MAVTFSVTEKNSQTWLTWTMHKTMKTIGMDTLVNGPKYFRGANASKVPPVGSPELDIPFGFRLKGCSVQHRVVEDFHVYDITPSKERATTSTTAPKKKLIYFAGGGFMTPASGAHWSMCAELANKIPNTTVVLVSYPLSPTNVASKAYASIQKAYLALLAEAAAKGETTIVGGDSAGGNLSLGLTASILKDDPKALYAPVVLAISPAVDTSHDNPDILTVEPFDPMLNKAYCKKASAQWRGDWPTSDPRLTVLNADLSVFASRNIHVIGVVGSYDVLAPDIMLFLEKSKAAGVSSEWLVWDKQMHCFPLAFSLGFPEGVEATDWIVKKLSK